MRSSTLKFKPHRRAVLTGMVAAAAVPALPAQAASDFNASIGWRGLEAGLGEARINRKPVFMVIHANWCPACRSYSSLFRDTEVISILGNYVPILADADREKGTRRYRPDGSYIPRSMVLSSEGEHYKDVTGPYEHRYFLPPDDAGYLLDYLSRGLARAGGGSGGGSDQPAVAYGDPVRKTVPGGDAGPSLARPNAPRFGSNGQTEGGPKRMTVPGTKTAEGGPVRKTVPGARAAPAPTLNEGGSEPGLIEKLLGKF